MKTIQECKDEVARKYGKASWFDWGYSCSEPYGKEIPHKYLEESWELYVQELQKRISELEEEVETLRQFDER